MSCQKCCSFGKSCSRINRRPSWVRNRYPNSFQRLRCQLKIKDDFRDDACSWRLSFARQRFIVWNFPQTQIVNRYELSTIFEISFVHAFSQTYSSGSPVVGTFESMSECPSMSNTFFSLTGPLVLPDVILRSKYPSSLSVERLNSPQVSVIFLTLLLTSHAYMHCPNSRIRG